METREVSEVWEPVGVGNVSVVSKDVSGRGTESWATEEAVEAFDD